MLHTKESGLPIKMNLPKVLKLALTRHALDRAQQYGLEDRILPEFDLSTAGAEILEMEICDHTKHPIKIFVRFPFNEKEDLYLAILLRDPMGNRFLVKTLWNRSVDEKNIKQKSFKRARNQQAEATLAYAG